MTENISTTELNAGLTVIENCVFKEKQTTNAKDSK